MVAGLAAMSLDSTADTVLRLQSLFQIAIQAAQLIAEATDAAPEQIAPAESGATVAWYSRA
jgi:hypothetical protein